MTFQVTSPSLQEISHMKAIAPLTLLASAALLVACGTSEARVDSAQTAAYVGATNRSEATPGNGSDPTCVTAADVKAALGFDVRELTKGMKHYGPLWSCGFAAADENALPGVTVKLNVEPASEANQRFDDMRSAVTVARGKPTDPDPVALGERALADRTSSKTMAAALSNGRLYSVEVMYGAVDKFGDKQPGSVTLLRKLMGA
jgi:hypothetical protein